MPERFYLGTMPPLYEKGQTTAWILDEGRVGACHIGTGYEILFALTVEQRRNLPPAVESCQSWEEATRRLYGPREKVRQLKDNPTASLDPAAFNTIAIDILEWFDKRTITAVHPTDLKNTRRPSRGAA